MFVIKCYLIAIAIIVLVIGMATGVCDDFPWKWLNTLCQVTFVLIMLFMLVSFVALLVGGALKGTL